MNARKAVRSLKGEGWNCVMIHFVGGFGIAGVSLEFQWRELVLLLRVLEFHWQELVLVVRNLRIPMTRIGISGVNSRVPLTRVGITGVTLGFS
jgi:hypothetical protein